MAEFLCGALMLIAQTFAGALLGIAAVWVLMKTVFR